MYVYHIYIYMIMIYVSVTKFDMRWKKENVLNFLEDGNCSQLVKGELCKTTSNGAQELAAISASRDWTYLLYCLFLRQQLQRKKKGANRKELYLKVEPPNIRGLSKSQTLCALEVAPQILAPNPQVSAIIYREFLFKHEAFWAKLLMRL